MSLEHTSFTSAVIDLGAFKNKYIIEIENLMDGEKIGSQIYDIEKTTLPKL